MLGCSDHKFLVSVSGGPPARRWNVSSEYTRDSWRVDMPFSFAPRSGQIVKEMCEIAQMSVVNDISHNSGQGSWGWITSEREGVGKTKTVPKCK